MSIDADRAARTLTRAWERFAESIPDGWTRREGGAQVVVTGVALPTLNGVWVTDNAAERSAVEALLERVAATGLPHCLQLRPGATPAIAEHAAQLRMSPAEDIPLMVLEDARALSQPLSPSGLTIREIEPRQAELHADIAAAGFEAPPEQFRQLLTPRTLGARGVRCYVGELDGEPSSTGLGLTVDEAVGVFNVATLPHARRRGCGAALTARAVADGVDDGARWAWLQSSAAGYGIYERLGFRTLERWHCFLAPAPGAAAA